MFTKLTLKQAAEEAKSQGVDFEEQQYVMGRVFNQDLAKKVFPMENIEFYPTKYGINYLIFHISPREYYEKKSRLKNDIWFDILSFQPLSEEELEHHLDTELIDIEVLEF